MSDTKECPYCAETVKAAAEKCRHCGEWLREEKEERGILYWEGDNVVVAVKGELYAAGCCLCGSERAFPVHKKFSYTPIYLYALFFVFGPLLLIALSGMQRWHSSLLLPMCQACKKGWQTSHRIYMAFVVLGMFMIPALCGTLGFSLQPRGGALRGVLFGLVAWAIGLTLLKFFYVNKKQAACRKITDESMTLRFPDPPLLRRMAQEVERLNAREPEF